jgi:hypothetical protein
LPDTHALLRKWAALSHVQLHVWSGPLPESVLRNVYAASEAAVVARRLGVTKESGWSSTLYSWGSADRLRSRPRAHQGSGRARLGPTCPTADGAGVLRDLAWSPLPRPAESAAAGLSVPTVGKQAGLLTELRDL